MGCMENDSLKNNVIELKKQLKGSNENNLKCMTFMDSRFGEIEKVVIVKLMKNKLNEMYNGLRTCVDVMEI